MDIIDIGAGFDFLGPLWAEIQDVFRGPATVLSRPIVNGWGRNEVRDLLKSKGLESWGYTLSADGYSIIFSVKRDQAELVELILSKAMKQAPKVSFWDVFKW